MTHRLELSDFRKAAIFSRWAILSLKARNLGISYSSGNEIEFLSVHEIQHYQHKSPYKMHYYMHDYEREE